MELNLILDYLTALEQNNDREWYHANKQQYQRANAAFEELVSELIMELHGIDEHIPLMKAKELTFKLMRDTRFSKDKSPYHPSFRAHIGPKGKVPIPVGYYLMIQPGNRSFLGGGLFADMFQDATTMMRDYLVTHGEEWQSIIQNPDFTSRFPIGGTKLKNVPKGYDKNDPQGEYLKNKSWYLEYGIPDEVLIKEDFSAGALEIFTAMKPFNDYLNQALKNFVLPSR